MKKVIAISGGFDPLHCGHVRNIHDAKTRGDYLIVILTRDDQLIQKKGFVFMTYAARKEILHSIKWVDEVVPNVDPDITSCDSLRLYAPNIYAKGGDSWNNENIPEAKVCKELGIEIIYGIGGFDKVESSSRLVKQFNTQISA